MGENPFISALQKLGLEVEVAADASTLKGHLSTGNYGLNWVISGSFFGGWPLGHVTELYGDPSTGKSYLVARAIAESQKFERSVAVLDDTESAFNNVWASSGLGIDINRLAYRQSHTVEEHYDLIIAYIQAAKDVKIKDASILALDSLALLTTNEEVKQGFKKENMKRAKEIKKLLRLTAVSLAKLPVAYLITNHAISNIGDIYHPKTPGGGSGPKFQASVRVELRSPQKLTTVDKKIVGVRINAFVEKNRLAVPWRKTSMIIPFYESISPVSGLVSLLLEYGVLTISGRSLLLFGEHTGIAANSSDPFKQDKSGEELLAKYPTLLEQLEENKDWGIPKKGDAMVPLQEDPEEDED